MKSLFLTLIIGWATQILGLFPEKEALAQWRGYGGWDMGPGMMGWGMMGWLGPIMMVVFWGVVIVAIIYLVRWLASSTRGSQTQRLEDAALEILKKRYARGEINKEEFTEKKKDLI